MTGPRNRRERRAAQRRHPSGRRLEAAPEVNAAHVHDPPSGPNAYRCTTCQGFTVTRHADRGVTPMFLACRAQGMDPATGRPVCGERAVSLMYPPGPVPAELVELDVWEWYRPAADELERMSAAMRDHVQRGGLDLRGPFPPAASSSEPDS